MITVTLPIERYNELLKIETDSLKGVEVEVINDEAISDALQYLFITGQNISMVKKMTGVEISMIDHVGVGSTTDGIIIPKQHAHKKLLVIRKIKKSTTNGSKTNVPD